MTGEELGFCIQELRAAGALEVWTTAIQMKKDRPGVCLSLLCRPEQRDALEAVAFARSSTLGVRSVRYERSECAREVLSVELLGETVRVKRRLRPGAQGKRPSQEIEWRDLSPEYDDLAALARRTGRSLSDLTREVIEQTLRQIQDKIHSRYGD